MGISKSKLATWIDEGLPIDHRKGRVRYFDEEEVEEWLVMVGYATRPTDDPPPLIASTRQEAASLLNIHVRTLAHWMTQEGFPGRAGLQGQQTGYFPIAEIQAWRDCLDGGKDGDSARELYHRARGMLKQLDLEERLGNVAEYSKLLSLIVRQINQARSILDASPDKILARLPSSIEREVRLAIRETIVSDINDVYQALEEILQGDTDEEEDDES